MDPRDSSIIDRIDSSLEYLVLASNTARLDIRKYLTYRESKYGIYLSLFLGEIQL